MITGRALLAVAGCLAIALSGCSARQTTGAHQTTSAHQTTGAHQATGAARAVATERPAQRAAADAAYLMASFPHPPRAVRTGLIDSLSAGEAIDTADLATATQWWRAPGQPLAVLSWVAAHMPAGFSLTGSGGGDYEPKPNPSTTVHGTYYDMFALPVVPNVLIQRWLVVLVAPYGNQTAIRVDAEVVWLPAKPAAERIPPAAKVVTVTPTYDGPPNPVNERADHAVTITNPATVARIAAAVDALPIASPSDGFCTPGPQVMVHLTFRPSPRGPVIALVNEVECWTVSVTIDGRGMPALSDGINAQRQFTPSLGEQVVTIAGLRWPFPPDP